MEDNFDLEWDVNCVRIVFSLKIAFENTLIVIYLRYLDFIKLPSPPQYLILEYTNVITT